LPVSQPPSSSSANGALDQVDRPVQIFIEILDYRLTGAIRKNRPYAGLNGGSCIKHYDDSTRPNRIFAELCINGVVAEKKMRINNSFIAIGFNQPKIHPEF